MFERIFMNFKTTIGGTAIGAAAMGAGYMVLEQAHCDFSQVQWFVVLGALFGGPAVQGMFSTDNGKTVVPVGVPKAVPVILLSVMLLGLVACASYIDYGNGRYGVVKDAQEPTAIGVSNSFSVLMNCEGRQREGYNYEKLDFSDCHPMTELKHASSPGWFPQLFTGISNLAGFGWLASTQSGGNASSSAASSSTSSASAIASGGHGGGKH